MIFEKGQAKLEKQLAKLGDAESQIKQLNRDLDHLVSGYGKEKKAKRVQIVESTDFSKVTDQGLDILEKMDKDLENLQNQ